MQTLHDQCERQVIIPDYPQRIVSLVPSQTELLHDLGLAERVIGITKFCIHPSEWFRVKTRVGGTKNPDFRKIEALNPDLILANKEENTREDLERLAEKYPVWISDIKTLEDAKEMILAVGEMTDTADLAEKLSNYISSAFTSMEPADSLRAIYLIWKNPWMAVNSDTFIHDIMHRCGLVNATADFPERYPVLPAEAIGAINPQLILLSSEPFPFSEKHIPELQRICPDARIGLVDGEAFSWYGSRLYN